METSTKFYLAGPMSGIPQANFPAFEAATADLRQRGLDIISPAEMDDPRVRDETMKDQTGRKHDHLWGEFLSRDVKLIADVCNGVVCLPGWEKSRGANLEVFVAIKCGHRLFTYAPEVPRGIVPMSYATAMQEINRNIFAL